MPGRQQPEIVQLDRLSQSRVIYRENNSLGLARLDALAVMLKHSRNSVGRETAVQTLSSALGGGDGAFHHDRFTCSNRLPAFGRGKSVSKIYGIGKRKIDAFAAER